MEPVVAQYVAAIQRNEKIEPIRVFFDGTEYCLADGFHRMHGSSVTGGGQCARVRNAETAKLRRGKGV